jgi:hypothetical protein
MAGFCFIASVGARSTTLWVRSGMQVTDLFPDKLDHHQPRMKPRFFASDLLRIIEREALIVSIVANDIAAGKTIPEQDRERCVTARDRIREALDHV